MCEQCNPGPILGAGHRLRAGPEQDTIFHLHVTACRRRGSHGHDQRLAWVASQGQGTLCSSSFVSKVLGANYKKANNIMHICCVGAVIHYTPQHQYIKILVVCPCVCDGCGRGRNKFAGRVQNHLSFFLSCLPNW